MANVMIFGSGGFGCALAAHCNALGYPVTLWTPFAAEADALRETRESPKLLPGVKLAPAIAVTTDAAAVQEADLVILATPSFAIAQTCQTFAPFLQKEAVVTCVAKGLDPDTLRRLDEVITDELPHHPCVILSGPSHAEEVAKGVPTTVVVASPNRAAAEYVQDQLMSPTLRLYVNDDVIGVELGGALKNVIALAAGICDGLELGDNTKAALMTRGITEIARLGQKMGAHADTFAGLAGIGDLIVTCTSMHSRNRRAGILIGKGTPVAEAIRQVGTVEGYAACRCAWQLASRVGVDMPIVNQTYAVLFEEKPPKQALRDLMDRPKRHESEAVWFSEQGQ